MTSSDTSIKTLCFHCGDNIVTEPLIVDDKLFCCAGCKGVYQILAQNNLCSYYNYNSSPGEKKSYTEQHLEYLNEPGIFSKLVDYTDEKRTLITFYIPAIHCSSCLWLLEHLHKIHPAVAHSRVDFLKKQVEITFDHHELPLKSLVEILISIGYEPLISLQDIVKDKSNAVNRELILKIAVSGFCMGNVMLFSFPEYLGLSSLEHQFQTLFGWLNLAFASVATFYCSRDFFVSAWGSLKNKVINLDTPLALIVAVLFMRSAYEIISGAGPGFSDTLTGLVFLLLMGRWVKQRTYNHISFNRDYRSYFPVAVTLLNEEGIEVPVPINDLEIGARILVRNNEIVPADSILMKGTGCFDFSFVTGESQPQSKVLGEIIYAGGRQIGEAIELEVVKPVSQSYLTRLWNNEAFKRSDQSKIKNFNDTIAQYFSLAVIAIALVSAGFWWYMGDTSKGWDAFSSVLIVACPCVLALSTPLTLSTVLGIFDRNDFYLKNTDVVEQLARIDTVVFDKTGTISCPETNNLTFSGELTLFEGSLVSSVARNSSHPLSRQITKWLDGKDYLKADSYREIPGKGISAFFDRHEVLMGSRSFVSPQALSLSNASTVHVRIDGQYKGYFKINQKWRTSLKDLIVSLKVQYRLHVISGDHSDEKKDLMEVFPEYVPMLFNQSPQDKLEYVQKLQVDQNVVMMLGDGLNDAGALRQSDLGVAVTDNINNFTPGSDAILKGSAMGKLPQFISQAKSAVLIIKCSFMIATIYNLIGVFFAVQGRLYPLTAAILMPMSTITIIILTNLANRYFAKKYRLR
ncbi:Type cbb3 cytochrome oxidase biogeneis protein CcoI [Arcticibacter svalbardensis MN12-7]|uniref:Type cbb3 cytochrome oxidase biogeneis protein CcoI n=1 Tax=Arcticibacter svalbardensis MN12-7 TaxID=1150600 RepID=R9H1U9_9SPHI|nr:heavy metal translocating P-type ATPase metal-binding domain-containing protein [Arcticibacter svalbardensis]EOR95159.1 Type cbb3 cytochrome oxidase biogeneis protein CcoI [Arcticibacter svalbardensis MN12-7]